MGTLTGQPPEPYVGRRNIAFAVSAVVHVVALLWLIHQPRPIFVKPSLLAHGIRESESIVYLAQKQGDDTVAGSREVQPHATSRINYQRRTKAERQQQSKPPEAAVQVAQSPNPPSNAGSPFGSELQGLASGHEVRPALPVIFPDPPIARSELPNEARGDVIVEITIDILGNVVGTKLLQGIGYGVDDVVLATVQKWRFRPATQDGTAIPSQQDVHFHFPS